MRVRKVSQDKMAEAPLMASISQVSFTGSVNTGKKIQVAAAQSNLKRVTLELGASELRVATGLEEKRGRLTFLRSIQAERVLPLCLTTPIWTML